MNTKELKARWSKEKEKQVNDALGINAFRKGGFINSPILPDFVQIFEEEVDLRGLTISAPIVGLKLSKYNFSHCKFELAGQFALYNTFEHCNFSSAILDTNVRGDFTNCNFTNTDLNEAILEKSFKDCLFENTIFDKTKIDNTVFESCRFISIKSRKTEFRNCSFINCNFIKVSFSHGVAYKTTYNNCCSEPEMIDMI